MSGQRASAGQISWRNEQPWSLPAVAGHARGQVRLEAVRRCLELVPRAAGRGCSAANDNADVIEAVVRQLQALMSIGNVGGARRLFSRLTPVEQAEPRLARWARALAPPRLRIGARGSAEGLEKNATWLKEHATDYFGQWVALRDGKLLGSHVEHAVLHRELERRGELQLAMFVRITNG